MENHRIAKSMLVGSGMIVKNFLKKGLDVRQAKGKVYDGVCEGD